MKTLVIVMFIACLSPPAVWAFSGSSTNYRLNYALDGAGLAKGSSVNYTLTANLLFQPVGQFQSTDYGLCLGPYCLAIPEAGPDTDKDGVPDTSDNCKYTPNTGQKDTDRDMAGDVCDNCPDIPNPVQADTDADTIGDLCDTCPEVGNKDQADSDGDTVGDLCDNCPDIANPRQEDGNGNGMGDACDLAAQDTDGDGVLDLDDNCFGTPNGPELGTCVQNLNGELVPTTMDCLDDLDCESSEFCSTNQEDRNGNGLGDACELNRVYVWSAVDSGTSRSLRAVWGSSGSDVFAVGNDGKIIHYDGIAWDNMSSGTSTHLRSVWGSSGSNVYAVGYNGKMLKYNGSEWRSRNSGTSRNLYGLWGTTATDIFSVGSSGKIIHKGGSGWSSMDSTTSSSLYDAWGSASNDVFVVGDNGRIVHYDGNNCSRMSSGSSEWLRDVWGASSSDVYAVGENGTILHYNGVSWNTMAYNWGYTLYGIWGSSATDILAVGEDGRILHYDGLQWIPQESGTNKDLTAVWGTGGGEVFVVGKDGIVLQAEVITGGVIDTDEDGVEDELDNCVNTPNGPAFGTCTIGEQFGFGCLTDEECGTDGYCSLLQEDTDGDTIGDACDDPPAPAPEICPAKKIYGENGAETILLRNFRDIVLSQTSEGRELIKLYYQWSPIIVEIMEEDENFKEEVKQSIEEVLPLIQGK